MNDFNAQYGKLSRHRQVKVSWPKQIALREAGYSLVDNSYLEQHPDDEQKSIIINRLLKEFAHDEGYGI